MTELAGLFEFDLRPVSQEDVDTVLSCIDGHWPGGVSIVSGPGLVMAEASASKRARQERFPECLDRYTASVCHWDGRLDNRGELIERTGLCASDNPSDGMIALAAYAAEGNPGFRRVIGDWSAALWDSAHEAVHLASDFAGIRPLYYQQTRQRLIWASSLRRLAALVGATPDLDDRYVLDFLSLGAAGERTPYSGVFAVPPGHCIRASRKGTCTLPFWSMPLEPMLRYSRESEYEEHLRILFQEAVQARLRTQESVCAELSGGLDSSSVVSMAHKVRCGMAETRSKLIALSYSERDSNDGKFIKAVETALDFSSIHLELGPGSVVSADAVGDAQPSWWEPRLKEITRQMRRIDSNVLLSGCLGDLVMGNWFEGTEQIAVSMAKGHIRESMKRAFAWSRCQRQPVYGLLWRAFRSNWGSVWADSWQTPGVRGIEHCSFAPEFRIRAEQLQQDILGTARSRNSVPQRNSRARALMEILLSRRLQSPDALPGINYTHPFAHRPLVEFMFSIPCDIVYRPGEPRRLMRNAFKGIVPDIVLRRRSKAGYGATYRASVLPLARELLQTPGMCLVEGGWIEPYSIRTRLERYVAGLECNEPQLRQIILLEFWLRKQKADRYHPRAATQGARAAVASA